MDELKKQVEEYQEIFNLLPIGLYRTSLKDGTFLKANPYCAKLLGFKTVEELIGKEKSTTFYVSPSDRRKFINELNQKDIVENFELELIRHDNTSIWVAVTGRISDKGYIEGSLMDITDRKILEEELNDYKIEEAKSLKLITEDAKRRCVKIQQQLV